MSGQQRDWTLRAAGREDCEALALIGAATFLESFAGILDGHAIVAHCARAHSASAYAQLFEKGAKAWLALAGEGKAPIGYALTAPPDLAAAKEGDIELKRIYVLSRYHGAGVGHALMQDVLASHTDRDRLLLGVYAANDKAIAFYERQGFSRIGTRRFDVGGTLYDDLVLARPFTTIVPDRKILAQ
ncbi:MAG: N-acetyltransferase [Erythrobacter sp.]|uniref:GNAT family N-acetyltransferase n=1 Tax=Erythrobacter sp. TaxID=1042 RepID=UPI003C73E570